MGTRFGLPVAIFAIKCFIAAFLALYIALRIGLERPYWSFMSSFIVAQPLAGAVISKGIYRAVGTVLGAIVAVLIVPPLSNSPELLTLALASWLALCVFVSVLDRTPRAYMFVLAGYSVSLIAFPSVDSPDQVFNVALWRLQEILVGIMCGSAVHGLILPGSVTELLLRKVDTVLRDTERWSSDSIAQQVPAELDAERRRLALDISELHQLSTHLPFETARLSPRVKVVRAFQSQMSRILPLGAAVQDRMTVLRQNGAQLSVPVRDLIEDVRAWLVEPSATRDHAHEEAAALTARCRALQPATGKDMSWRAMVGFSLLSRLEMLIAVHRDCRDISEQMRTYSRKPVTPRIAELLQQDHEPELHRDYEAALRGAFGAFITIIVCSALWIGSGWKDGASAVMLAGVFLALFSAVDNQIAALKKFMVGTLIATLIGLIYGYAIMPRLDGLWMLAAAFAPVLLAGFALMTSRWSGTVMAMLMGLGSPSLLEASYTNVFPTFINGAIAQIVGIWLAIVMTRLTQTVGVEGAIDRINRRTWRDMAKRCLSPSLPDLRGWMALMVDRIALVTPRLAALGADNMRPLTDITRDLRAGLSIGELRLLALELPKEEAEEVNGLLHQIAAYYQTLSPRHLRPPRPRVLRHIDAAIARFVAYPDEAVRKEALRSLVGLRRDFFPAAPAYGVSA